METQITVNGKTVFARLVNAGDRYQDEKSLYSVRAGDLGCSGPPERRVGVWV